MESRLNSQAAGQPRCRLQRLEQYGGGLQEDRSAAHGESGCGWGSGFDDLDDQRTGADQQGPCRRRIVEASVAARAEPEDRLERVHAVQRVGIQGKIIPRLIFLFV